MQRTTSSLVLDTGIKDPPVPVFNNLKESAVFRKDLSRNSQLLRQLSELFQIIGELCLFLITTQHWFIPVTKPVLVSS
jgi:hypothetical protein